VSARDEGRRFATILFTDTWARPTSRASSVTVDGELVRRHRVIVRRELKRLEGREMDTAGDGFFAIFDSPGAAIRCAVAISRGVREIGLEIRAGLHGGEVEFEAAKPAASR
jgi:class 3 adenylate cyclase